MRSAIIILKPEGKRPTAEFFGDVSEANSAFRLVENLDAELWHSDRGLVKRKKGAEKSGVNKLAAIPVAEQKLAATIVSVEEIQEAPETDPLAELAPAPAPDSILPAVVKAGDILGDDGQADADAKAKADAEAAEKAKAEKKAAKAAKDAAAKAAKRQAEKAAKEAAANGGANTEAAPAAE